MAFSKAISKIKLTARNTRNLQLTTRELPSRATKISLYQFAHLVPHLPHMQMGRRFYFDQR